MTRESDPTKDPEFQKVLRHFVTKPPKTHAEMKKEAPKNRPASKGRVPIKKG